MSLDSQGHTEYTESSVNIQSFLIFLLALIIGLLAAVIVLPIWLPNLAFSLSGEAPKAYWYLSRASAFVSLSLLWLAMALGIGLTNKMARLWPGAAPAFAIHEYVNLLGLAFAIVHGLLLLGDRYINFTFWQLLTPFATAGYRPFWVGVGQIGFYFWIVIALSFYVRRLIGQKTWRFIHYASFAMYVLGLAHGIFGGTDSAAAQMYYWYSGGSLLFLLLTRIVGSILEKLIPTPTRFPPQHIT